MRLTIAVTVCTLYVLFSVVTHGKSTAIDSESSLFFTLSIECFIIISFHLDHIILLCCTLIDHTIFSTYGKFIIMMIYIIMLPKKKSAFLYSFITDAINALAKSNAD